MTSVLATEKTKGHRKFKFDAAVRHDRRKADDRRTITSGDFVGRFLSSYKICRVTYKSGDF